MKIVTEINPYVLQDGVTSTVEEVIDSLDQAKTAMGWQGVAPPHVLVDLNIRILHLGDCTYMVTNKKITALCDRDLESTPLPIAVDMLGWDLIKEFPEKFERELLIDWVLDNRIWMIPLGRRTELVIQRAERRIKEAIDELVGEAKLGMYKAKLARSRQRASLEHPSPRHVHMNMGMGNTGVNLHQHPVYGSAGGGGISGGPGGGNSGSSVSVGCSGGGGGGGPGETWNGPYELFPHQQSVLDNVRGAREWFPSMETQQESRVHRPVGEKPTIHVVTVHPDHLELIDGKKLQYR